MTRSCCYQGEDLDPKGPKGYAEALEYLAVNAPQVKVKTNRHSSTKDNLKPTEIDENPEERVNMSLNTSDQIKPSTARNTSNPQRISSIGIY